MKRSSKWKSAAVAIGVLALGGGAWLWLGARAARSEAVEYATSPVDRGDLAETVTATGTLSPVVTVQVGSQVSGRIQALYADFNQEVKKGEVIAKIDPSLFATDLTKARAGLASAKAAVTRAEAELQNARVTEQRTSDLVKRRLVAQSEADSAIAAFRSAQAQLVSAKAGVEEAASAVERAKANLAYTTIVSPIDGIVVSRDVDVGQTVAASLQAPTLFNIAGDLAKMEIHTNVAESDVGRLEPGQRAEFTVDAFPSRTFEGVVKQVRYAPQTVQNVVTYDAVVSVENDDLKLRPGMTADVAFVVESREGVLRVPNLALRFRPSEELLAQIRPPDAANGGDAGPGARRPNGGFAGAPRGGRPGGGGAGPVTGARAGGPNAAHGQGGARAEAGSADGSQSRVLWTLGKDGRPQPVRVHLGITDGRYTEIVGGRLAEGQAVITGASGGKGLSPEEAARRRFGRFL